MGFTTGFTGGVTLVLGAALLTLQAHQRTRARQADALRAQTYVLNSLTYVPASAGPPRSVAQELALLEHQQELLARAQHRHHHGVAAAHRGFLDRAKDRWNREVAAAVRWAAHTDWTAAREDAERAAARVWARATGGEDARRVAAAAQDSAESMWERGVKRGREWVGGSRDAVKTAAAAAATAQSDVERALQQRYEGKGDDVMRRSVDEVLAERYVPLEERDRSKLRGL